MRAVREIEAEDVHARQKQFLNHLFGVRDGSQRGQLLRALRPSSLLRQLALVFVVDVRMGHHAEGPGANPADAANSALAPSASRLSTWSKRHHESSTYARAYYQSGQKEGLHLLRRQQCAYVLLARFALTPQKAPLRHTAD